MVDVRFCFKLYAVPWKQLKKKKTDAMMSLTMLRV